MIKLLNVSDLLHISHMPEEVQTYALEALTILDEEYGKDRDLITGLGGYIVILEKSNEIEELEKLHHCDLTKNPYPEYVDFIFTEHGPLYTASLFLLSFDYGIIMILPYEMTPKRNIEKVNGHEPFSEAHVLFVERRILCRKKLNSSKTPSTARSTTKEDMWTTTIPTALKKSS